MEQQSPPCGWYVSILEGECGKPSVADVLVKSRKIAALVPLCERHKAEHDRIFAEIRSARKSKKQGG